MTRWAATTCPQWKHRVQTTSAAPVVHAVTAALVATATTVVPVLAVAARAARLGVALSPARPQEAGSGPAVLLAFGHLSPEALRQAVRRLRALS